MHKPNHKVCIAPMMNHTDRHFRYLLRLLSKHVMLYTEMVTTGALIHGQTAKLLQYNPQEHPIAIQLGGSNPQDLARCARLAAAAGYDEVNLNVGCPSNRVQSGKFGACLMAEPDLVAECVDAMRAAIDIPVTVKCRTGIDDHDSYDALFNFVHHVAASGCRTFIIHARKACLQGLSPRQNREVPPLKYDYVHRIKADFPDLEIVINGGITTTGQIQEQLQHVDGTMLGRTVCQNPYLLLEIETTIFNNQQTTATRNTVLQTYMEYVHNELLLGTPLSYLTRNIIGLFHGRPGARSYRRFLSANIHRRDAGIEVIKEAISYVQFQTEIESNLGNL